VKYSYFFLFSRREFPKASQSFWQPVGSFRKLARVSGSPSEVPESLLEILGRNRYYTGDFLEIEAEKALFGDFTLILLELSPFLPESFAGFLAACPEFRIPSQDFWEAFRNSGLSARISGKLSGTPDCLPGFRGRKRYCIEGGLEIEAVNALLEDFALIIV
jgi:hypothetical protein